MFPSSDAEPFFMRVLFVRILFQCFKNNILYVSSDKFLFFTRQLLRIDWGAVFDCYIGWNDARKMILEHGRCIGDGYRDDRAAGFGGNFERSFVEGEQLSFAFVIAARSFRENHNGNSAFDMVDRCKDRLHTFTDIGTVQKEAVQKLHPAGQKRYFEHFLFGNVAGQVLAACIRQDNVKIAAVIADKKHGCIFGNIFFSDHGQPDTGERNDNLEGALDDAERADVAKMRIPFSDQPFHQKNGNGQNQK